MMPENQYEHLTVELTDKVCQVTLNRPEVRNAFNRALIDELRWAFEHVAALGPGQVRVTVLSGAGAAFCAGADVNWMRDSLQYSKDENVADALRMARMFDAINRCPTPVIARIHGAALGGGVGLAAVSDIVVAAQSTIWAFSEAKLGIAPAVISPYVLAKIGPSHARALFFTAERFDTGRAVRIGLAHVACADAQLDEAVAWTIREVMSSGPSAIARAKELIATVPTLPSEEVMQHTAETIAALRISPEGQEGLRAFLEKRKPGWAE